MRDVSGQVDWSQRMLFARRVIDVDEEVVEVEVDEEEEEEEGS